MLQHKIKSKSKQNQHVPIGVRVVEDGSPLVADEEVRPADVREAVVEVAHEPRVVCYETRVVILDWLVELQL